VADQTRPANEPGEAILHVASVQGWQEARRRGRYEAESLQSEGFIHCSRPHQVVEVLNRLFRGRGDLLLLAIDPARLTPELRFERAENGQEYPHIYGPIDLAAVTAARAILPGQDGRFDTSLLDR
jgi:uncharacterized protein (DUF952 family)